MMLQADHIFYNGIIYTMRAPGEAVSAIAVRDGKLLAAGKDAELLSIPSAGRTDLGGRVVLPGFVNTHCHMADFAEDLCKINLSGTTSIAEVQERLRQGLDSLPEQAWLNAYQLDMLTLQERRLPTRWELDEVSEDVPIFISHICKHNFVLNSRALELAGIDASLYGTPAAAYLAFDAHHEPDGHLKEHGLLGQVFDAMTPVFSEERFAKDKLAETVRDYASKGFTTIHSFGGFNRYGLEQPRIYQLLEAENRLPVRVILNNTFGPNRPRDVITGFGTAKIRYGAVKFFADGSLYQWSAYLTEDYTDAPGQRGMLATDAETLRSGLREAYELGNDLAIHVIGDGALDLLLSWLAEFRRPDDPQRVRLIHCTYTRRDQWDEIARLRLIIDAQPVFVDFVPELGRIRLGEARTQTMFNFRSWLERGIIVTGGDDSPICDNNPFLGIRYAVLRESSHTDVQTYPEECISVYDAVRLYTANAAHSGGEERIRGTLEPGKHADFIVIDRDIFRIAPEEISDTRVLETYLDGVRAYAAQ